MGLWFVMGSCQVMRMYDQASLFLQHVNPVLWVWFIIALWFMGMLFVNRTSFAVISQHHKESFWIVYESLQSAIYYSCLKTVLQVNGVSCGSHKKFVMFL